MPGSPQGLVGLKDDYLAKYGGVILSGFGDSRVRSATNLISVSCQGINHFPLLWRVVFLKR